MLTEKLPAVISIENGDSSNKEAERALLGIRKKLENNVSVKCQVNELIQIARDHKNLCRMFPGWQP
ncbi:hypothetical protein HK096_003275, partial [Nowakowskiella sp. JEL0078]